MNCSRFEDLITDYLDGALDSCVRAEFAAHRLCCCTCRELFNDVRAAVAQLGTFARDESASPPGLEARLIAATTAGQMLSCREFDRLIERYFDGVILAPTFQTFQAHFAECAKCRRLLAGIEEAIRLCREVKEDEVEVPGSLCDRIVAATVGKDYTSSSGLPAASWMGRSLPRCRLAIEALTRRLWTPGWAAAALIFAASGLVIISRFGSAGAMALEASTRIYTSVTEARAVLKSTGAMTLSGIQRVSDEWGTLMKEKKKSPTMPPAATPSGDQDSHHPPAAGEPERSEEHKSQKRPGGSNHLGGSDSGSSVIALED